MIGNREVTEKQRKNHWARYEAHKGELPGAVCELINRVDRLNSEADVGFRRKNLSALLSNYFFDMKEVLQGMNSALRPDRMAFVVVGNNHTIAGGHRVEIETATLLQKIAESVGFRAEAPIPMEMLTSRDIFRRNTLASEAILCLRKRTQK